MTEAKTCCHCDGPLPEGRYAICDKCIPPQRKILRNSAKCLLCGDEIESKHRHDWVQCSCKTLFVDGGKDYLRRGYRYLEDWEDTSLYEE